MIKRIFSLIFVIVLAIMSGCSAKEDNKVVIYSSSEEFRNEHVIKRLKEQFPNYNITLQYQSTGNNAAKIKAEGTKTECDIVLGLETGYLEMLKDNFTDLSSYDTSVYLDGIVPEHGQYLPWERFSGCIVINPAILAQKELQVPESYSDLLKPEYKGLISMPNPKSSGTGFIFLRSLINTMGEDEAFRYFDQLAPNILQFTSSGSGPVNALVQGEAAIGLGMTFQAINEVNNGVKLEVHYFNEGAPYTMGGMAIIDGKQNDTAVKEVFDFIYSTLIYEDKELFVPEIIFKNQQNNIPNYPKDIPYADMTGINDIAEKERLLAKWTH